MKFGLLITISLCMALQMSAQDRREEIKEKIESKKIAYLSDKLDLSPEEAQVFWPLYNEYNEELWETRFSGAWAPRRAERTERKDEITDAEADKLLESYISSQQSEIDIKRKYTDKFKGVIGSIKTLKLWRSERKFKEDILKQTKHKRKGRSERR